jgi:hypothetical protein
MLEGIAPEKKLGVSSNRGTLASLFTIQGLHGWRNAASPSSY